MSSASWCRVRGFVLPAQSKNNRTLRLLFEELCWNICQALLQNNTSRMEKHDVFLHHIKTRWSQACTYYGWKILSFNNASILHIYCELLIMSYQCNWFTVYHICVSRTFNVNATLQRLQSQQMFKLLYVLHSSAPNPSFFVEIQTLITLKYLK